MLRTRLAFASLVFLAGCPANNGASNQIGQIEIRPVSPRPSATATPRGETSPGPTATPDPPASSEASPDLPASTAASPTPTPQPGTSPTPTPVPTATADNTGAASLDDVKRSFGAELTPRGKVSITTGKGTLVAVLFPDQAAKACSKFLELAKAGVYDGTTFHRVIPGFVAQGGDPQSRTLDYNDPRIGYGTYGASIPDEFENGLKHLAGSLAFAHDAAANSSNCQFYICLAPLPSLDNRYIVFGHVVEGFAAVKALTATELDGKPTGARPDAMGQVRQLE